ncbi:MAG: PadR family transcriptional regulator [Longimicrobiales bacterium]
MSGPETGSQRRDATAAMTTAEFHILLALAGSVRHGLGIAQAVDESTAGEVALGPGTLYRSLKQMSDAGWISHASAPAGEDDPRRRFYEITPDGRVRLQEAAKQFAQWVQVAKDRDVLPETA